MFRVLNEDNFDYAPYCCKIRIFWVKKDYFLKQSCNKIIKFYIWKYYVVGITRYSLKTKVKSCRYKSSCFQLKIYFNCFFKSFCFFFDMEILWFLQDDNFKLQNLWFCYEFCLWVTIVKLTIIWFCCENFNILFPIKRKLGCRVKNILFYDSQQHFNIYNIFLCKYIYI